MAMAAKSGAATQDSNCKGAAPTHLQLTLRTVQRLLTVLPVL